jgi:hypothetical protein
MSVEHLSIDRPLSEWFEAYGRDVAPNAKQNTRNGWRAACGLLEQALGRTPLGTDLTTATLGRAEKRLLRQKCGRTYIATCWRTLTALWRYAAKCGEAIETPPRNGHWQSVGPGRSAFGVEHIFKAVSGFLPAPRTIEVSETVFPLPDISLPEISGPSFSDFSAAEAEAIEERTAKQAELRRLAGTLLFTWLALYQEWACIADSPTRRQGRFTILRFAEFLGHPPELDDLTHENLELAESFIAGNFSPASARRAFSCLRTIWRFAWEAGAVLEFESRVNRRWGGKRLGRPSYPSLPIEDEST